MTFVNISPRKSNHQRRALKDPTERLGESRGQHRRDVLKSQHRAQSEQTTHERVAIHNAGKGTAEGDVDNPVEYGDGRDGPIAANSEVAKQHDHGNGADGDGVKNAGFDEEVLRLDDVGSGDDCGAVGGAGVSGHGENSGCSFKTVVV